MLAVPERQTTSPVLVANHNYIPAPPVEKPAGDDFDPGMDHIVAGTVQGSDSPGVVGLSARR